MKNRKLDLLRELLTEQMNHWLLFPMALMVMGLSGRYSRQGGPAVALWALCGLLPLLFFIIRDRFHRFFTFLLLHLAVTVPVVLLPTDHSINHFLYVACAVGYMIHSYYIRLKRDSPYTTPIHPGIGMMLAAASIMLQHYQGEKGWDFYYVSGLVGALALYVLILYIQQYQDFLAVNESSAGHLPAAEMFRSGFLLVLCYVVLGAVFLLLCANIGNFGSLWAMVKGWLRNLLSRLVSLPVQEEQVDQLMPEMEMPMDDFNAQLPEAKGPFLFWQILEIVALVFMTVALVVFAVRLLIAVILLIRKRFAQALGRSKGGQEVEEDMDFREKCGVTAIPLKRRSLTDFLSPAQRIRRLFKKRLLADVHFLAEGKPQRLGLYTPRECGERLEEEQMAKIYEQVRYSDIEATTDTLRQMKRALHQKKQK